MAPKSNTYNKEERGERRSPSLDVTYMLLSCEILWSELTLKPCWFQNTMLVSFSQFVYIKTSVVSLKLPLEDRKYTTSTSMD